MTLSSVGWCRQFSNATQSDDVSHFLNFNAATLGEKILKQPTTNNNKKKQKNCV